MPGGVRLGAHALTSRGLTEQHFTSVVEYIDEAVQLGQAVQAKSKKLKDFKEVLLTDPAVVQQCEELKKKVTNFASVFPMPGHEDY